MVRGDTYQRQLYNGNKKLKKAHKTIQDQSASLTTVQAENGELHHQVHNLEGQVHGLEAESSSLCTESDRLLA
jgi:peptidoglycan hydrolase CwlO-like protein